MVILTTNLLQNLDSAFTRRFKYIVDFPLPDEALRERIWRQVFPAAAPRSERIDFGFLSRKFQLTGANIKNVAVNAAFLAASNGGVIDMPHIIKAIKREFQKMGKMPNRSDFGPYYEWIREAKVG
jgi:SpoVK/Ycf46/Vps4 family AAA+-type ATPase